MCNCSLAIGWNGSYCEQAVCDRITCQHGFCSGPNVRHVTTICRSSTWSRNVTALELDGLALDVMWTIMNVCKLLDLVTLPEHVLIFQEPMNVVLALQTLKYQTVLHVL